MNGWSVGQLVGWSVGQLVGGSVGGSVGLLVESAGWSHSPPFTPLFFLIQVPNHEKKVCRTAHPPIPFLPPSPLHDDDDPTC